MVIQMTANKIHQDGHGRLPFPPSCGTLLLPGRQRRLPTTLPHRAALRTTRASPREG